MMGLPCCVLTHSPVKDRASTSQVYYSGQVLPEIQEGHGVCSGHPQSVSVGTGPLRGMEPPVATGRSQVTLFQSSSRGVMAQ